MQLHNIIGNEFNIKKILLYGSITVYVLFFVKFCVFPGIPSRLYFALDEAWGDTPIDSVLYINFAHITPFEWDTMYYYERHYPSDSINERHNKRLGFSYSEKCFNLVFKQDGEIVCEDEYYCPCCEVEGTVMISPYAKDWKIDRSSAKFLVYKTDGLFYLQRVDSLRVQ